MIAADRNAVAATTANTNTSAQTGPYVPERHLTRTRKSAPCLTRLRSHGLHSAASASPPSEKVIHSLSQPSRARDILPKNIRLKLSFTIHIILALENASSHLDELSTEVAFIL